MHYDEKLDTYLIYRLRGMQVSEPGAMSHIHSLGLNVYTCLCEQHKVALPAEWKYLSWFGVRINLDALVNLFNQTNLFLNKK